MSETALVQRALLALSEAGHLVHRNNTGVLRDQRGRPVRFGVVGSGDIIGCLVPHGLYFEAEAKSEKGSIRNSQMNRAEAVGSAGGIYIVFRSVEELMLGLNAAIGQRIREAA